MRLASICKLGVCLLLALAACQRATEPATTPALASEPELAVQQLARHLHDSNLEGYARASVPAADYVQLEAAWNQNRSRWPLTELPLDDQLQPLLATLGAAEAEHHLERGFQRNFANQHRDLREAARSLGLFAVQYVRNEGNYSEEERAHYVQVIAALAHWAETAPLGDPALAKRAIAGLARAARQTGLRSEQDFQAAGMTGCLRQLRPLLSQLKTTVADYGLPLAESLAGLRTELVEQTGNQAKVRIRYPLGSKQVETLLTLQREQGRWYLSGSLRHAREALAPPPAEPGDEELGFPLPSTD